MNRSNRLRLGLVVGAVVVSIVCVIGLGIYSAVSRYGSSEVLGSGSSWDHALPPAPQLVEEVQVEKLVEAAAESGARRSYDAPGLAHAAERLIIHTGNIALVVEDTRASQATIETMVTSMAGQGAFVVSSQEYGTGDGSQPHITMHIRVPAARFDETMDHLAQLAVVVTSRNESAEDVTEEYVDLEARLESLGTARQRLLEIMQNARTTEDLLQAEQQLTQREAEMESIKGRMQYLEQSAQLSSIQIELQPSILSQPVGDQWRPAETARRAVRALLDGLRGFGDFLIVFVIAVLPWLVALGLAVLAVVSLVRWRIRVRRARRSTDADAPEQ